MSEKEGKINGAAAVPAERGAALVPAPPGSNLGSLAPRTLEEAMKFSAFLAKSSIIPKDFAGKPENILVAIQWGMEIGLAPMQAMQNIAVINGRPFLWGDALMALVIGSPVCKSIEEWYEGEGDQFKAVCKVLRKGDSRPHVVEFSIEDAKKAKLWGKAGPWSDYPKRMLKMRARAWAIRDKFADALRGMPCAEEVMDIEPGEGYEVIERGKPQVSMPQSTKAEPSIEAETEAGTGQQTETQEGKINTNALGLLKRTLDNKGIDHGEFCKHLDIEKLEDLEISRFNDAMNDAKRWEAQP